MVTRRTVLQASMAAAIAAGTPMGWVIRQAGATALPASVPLADPAWLFDNNKAFTTDCPDAMAPSFVYTPNRGKYNLMVSSSTQDVGLVDSNGNPLGLTDVWGYGPVGGTPTWPGMTFEVKRNDGVKVYWENMLSTTHVMDYALDTSLHWCYALHGYTDKSIGVNGVPIVTHLHGGNTDYHWDGNPELF